MTYFYIEDLDFQGIAKKYPEAGPAWDVQYGNRPEIAVEYFTEINYPELNIDFPNHISDIEQGHGMPPLPATLFAVTSTTCYRWHNIMKIWVRTWTRLEGDWSWAVDNNLKHMGVDPIFEIYTKFWLDGWIKRQRDDGR